MHFQYFLIILIHSLWITECTQAKTQTAESPLDTITIIDTTQNEIERSENELWMHHINSNPDSLQYLYTENAIKILPNESQLTSNKKIQSYHSSSDLKITSIKTDTLIIAHKDKAITYELGEFIDAFGAKYKHLIIWKTSNGIRKRDFEFIVKYNLATEAKTEIDVRRNQWMMLCNAHNANALIEEMYSINTMYYNHKPLLIGRDQLVNEYQYMNNNTYSLTLFPIVSQHVNEDFVFEIGQCAGGYNGKYIIVWRKNNDGKWEVFIDSNI